MWYLQVNLSAEQLAAMTEAQRQVYEATPGWLNIAFAVAVFAGVLGALGHAAEEEAGRRRCSCCR